MRAAGFEETRAKYYPGLEIIATGEGQFAREPARKAMENIPQANLKIDAVYSMDDEQSLWMYCSNRATQAVKARCS